jgi:hypothetical protein
MAILASVTVSIAAVTTGVLSLMLRVNQEPKLTSRGKTSEYEGINRTSSKVKPSDTTLSAKNDIFMYFYHLVEGQNYKKKKYKSPEIFGL